MKIFTLNDSNKFNAVIAAAALGFAPAWTARISPIWMTLLIIVCLRPIRKASRVEAFYFVIATIVFLMIGNIAKNWDVFNAGLIEGWQAAHRI